MDYTELVEAIESTTENTFDVTGSTNIDRIIRQAEQYIYNTVQLPAERKNVTGSMTANNPYLELPTDFLAPFSLAVVSTLGVYTYLLNKEPDFMREAYPDPTATGTPAHYAVFDKDTVILGPTPSASLTAALAYFAYPESIVTATNTWLGDNYDMVLFTQCLVQAALFMKSEQDTVTLYKEQYKQAVALLKNLSEGRLKQDEYRSGAPRTQVV